MIRPPLPGEDLPEEGARAAELTPGAAEKSSLLLSDSRLRQRDYLLKVARAMSARLDTSEVLARVIRYAVDITGGNAGAIAMRQPDGSLRVVASYRLEGVFEEEWAVRRATEAVAGPEDLEQRDLQSSGRIVALPLAISDEVIGRIVVVRSEGAAVFTPLDGEALQSFADQAAVAIHNARLYQDLAERTRQVERLHAQTSAMLASMDRRGACEETARYALSESPGAWAGVVLLVGEPAVVVLSEPNQDKTADKADSDDALAAASRDERLAAADRDERLAAASREAAAAGPAIWTAPDDMADRLRLGGGSAASAPIPVSGATAGVLWSAAGEPRAIDRPHLDMLETMARNLGLALERFDLLDEIATRQRQLASVIENHPSGILVADSDGIVRAANPAALRMAGRDVRRETIAAALALVDEMGRPLALHLPHADRPNVERGHLLREGAPGPYVQVTLEALPSAAGAFAPVLAEIVDVTAVKDAEHAKTAFLAGLSHELKTPLSVIRGFAETLGYDAVRADDKMWREGIDVILSETDHLTRIVDRLLTAARLQAGALGLDLDEVDVAHLLVDQVDSFRRVHPDRVFDVGGDTEATVRGDADQLREVFGNLLSNAVKFSSAGTRVSAMLETAADEVRVSISDEGPGVPASDREHVFERFFRGSTDREGTGLGLYMSRAIAEAHGGQLMLDEPEGAGARFVVVLPRSGPIRRTAP